MTYSDPKRSFSRTYRREGRRIEPRRRSRARGPNPWVIVGSVIGGLALIGLVITVVILASKPTDSKQSSDTLASQSPASENTSRALFPLLTDGTKPSAKTTPSSAIPGGVREPPPEFIRANLSQVERDVRAINYSAANGDVSVVMDHTYPKLLEFMGGRRNAELALKTVFLQLQAANMRLESFSFPENPRFLETNAHYYAIVPTRSIMSVNGHRIECLACQLAILEKGATAWKYIDASGTDQGLLQTLVPDFPSHIKFPKRSERSL